MQGCLSDRKKKKLPKPRELIGGAEMAPKNSVATLAHKIMKEGIMSETVVGRTAEYIAESVGQASRVTSAVADAAQVEHN
jgi:hypothetical protein